MPQSLTHFVNNVPSSLDTKMRHLHPVANSDELRHQRSLIRFFSVGSGELKFTSSAVSSNRIQSGIPVYSS